MTAKTPHKPSNDTRDLVELLVFMGEPRTDICINLGISTKDLEQHYRDELLIGGVKKRHALFARMHERAMSDSGSALPAIRELLERHDRTRMVQRPAEDAPAPRLGKKEQQEFAAQNPDEGTSMGGLLAQRLGEAGRPN